MSEILQNFRSRWLQTPQVWFAAKNKKTRDFMETLCADFPVWKWDEFPPQEISDPRDRITLAVMLDQMPRNARALGLVSQAEVDSCDLKAREIFLQLEHGNFVASVSAEELCFFSLVPRHAKTLEMVEKSGNFLQRQPGLLDLPLAQKFAAETEKARRRRAALEWLHAELSEKIPEIATASGNCDGTVLDERCRQVGNCAAIGNLKQVIEQSLSEVRRENEEEVSVLLSLSGGVDSVAHLACLSEISGIRLACLVLTYPRSVETELPWIVRIGNVLKIPIYHRHVALERPRDRETGYTRDEFEIWTKALRFDAYEKTLEIFAAPNSPRVVVLGHHADDRDENIFEQISRGHVIGDLAGMAKQIEYAFDPDVFSEISSELKQPFRVPRPLTVLRPCIERRKSEMVETASQRGLWWMKDSTPHWSVRGQTRKIIDHLQDQGIDVKKELSRIHTEAFKAGEVFQENIEKWKSEKIQIRSVKEARVWLLPMQEILGNCSNPELMQRIAGIGNSWNKALTEVGSALDVSALSRVPVEKLAEPESPVFEKILLGIDFRDTLTLKAIRHVFSQRPLQGTRSGGFTEDLGFIWLNGGAELVVYESPGEAVYMEGFKQEVLALFE